LMQGTGWWASGKNKKTGGNYRQKEFLSMLGHTTM